VASILSTSSINWPMTASKNNNNTKVAGTVRCFGFKNLTMDKCPDYQCVSRLPYSIQYKLLVIQYLKDLHWCTKN